MVVKFVVVPLPNEPNALYPLPHKLPSDFKNKECLYPVSISITSDAIKVGVLDEVVTESPS